MKDFVEALMGQNISRRVLYLIYFFKQQSVFCDQLDFKTGYHFYLMNKRRKRKKQRKLFRQVGDAFHLTKEFMKGVDNRVQQLPARATRVQYVCGSMFSHEGGSEAEKCKKKSTNKQTKKR